MFTMYANSILQKSMRPLPDSLSDKHKKIPIVLHV